MSDYVDVMPLDESYDGTATVLYFDGQGTKPLAVSHADAEKIHDLLGRHDHTGREIILGPHPDGVHIRVKVVPQ